MILEKTEKMKTMWVARQQCHGDEKLETRERVTNEGKPRGNTKRMVGVQYAHIRRKGKRERDREREKEGERENQRGWTVSIRVAGLGQKLRLRYGLEVGSHGLEKETMLSRISDQPTNISFFSLLTQVHRLPRFQGRVTILRPHESGVRPDHISRSVSEQIERNTRWEQR